MRKRSLVGLAVLWFTHLAISAATDARDLVVFPAVLPPAPAVFDDSSPPVVRWDQVLHASQEGVKLLSAAESTSKSPEAMMAYDSGAGETLLVHVLDDPKVMAPATRLAQERSLEDAGAILSRCDQTGKGDDSSGGRSGRSDRWLPDAS